MGQLEERLQAAQQEAQQARSAQQAAEDAAAELRARQEGDVQALVQHHADEVSCSRAVRHVEPLPRKRAEPSGRHRCAE